MKRVGSLAAMASVQALIAACSAGGPTHPDTSTHSGGSSSPPTPPPPAATAPSITRQPIDVQVITGDSATFTATAAGTNVKFQWQRNGVDIPGAVTSTYTTSAVAWGDEGATFTVVASNSVGTATSSKATLHLALSPDQQAFESFALNGGIFETDWELVYSGALDPASDWFESFSTTLPRTPLTNGPQVTTETGPANLSTTLPTHATPTRILKGGSILVIPPTDYRITVSYEGSEIRLDNLAEDGTTIAYSERRSAYVVHALTGPLSQSPTELKQPYNDIFANPAILDQTQSWADGAAYLTFKDVMVGDRYGAFDCLRTTTDAAISPCYTSTTLQAALTTGIASTSDGTTYHLADGTMTTVDGTQVWVATAPRPASGVGTATVEYRIYFALQGNVCTGALTRDGTEIDSGNYRTDPTDPATKVYISGYRVRLDAAANATLASASRI